ncbi:hypothetical protein [Azospirillum sp. BE72]|uniref:hypothetical protein n=1 Tax=Azospirillum sp. BE72 TaxID=2817776 RepID=UPI0028626018|nr:hypothetical protein [Azospirillum sp. BE72]MDR6775725.1 antitoxin component of RelBE/YafQ-DinJ toxin-antitoxin module [Azospirillum sp. BE72]
MNFLLPLSDKGKSKMISCRIDEALYNAFQDAAERAEGRGLGRLSITHVVEQAMRMAISQVNGSATQQELPFDAATADEQQDEQQDDEQEHQPDAVQEKPKRSRKPRKTEEVQSEQQDSE